MVALLLVLAVCLVAVALAWRLFRDPLRRFSVRITRWFELVAEFKDDDRTRTGKDP